MFGSFIIAGQLNGEGGAAAESALNFYGAAVGFDVAFGDSQSQAAAACGTVTGFFSAVETLENVRQVFSADAHAVVFNFENEPLSFFVGAQNDGPAVWRIAQGIIDQIEHDLFEALLTAKT